VPQLIHTHTPEVHGNLKYAGYSVDSWMLVDAVTCDSIALESVDFTHICCAVGNGGLWSDLYCHR